MKRSLPKITTILALPALLSASIGVAALEMPTTKPGMWETRIESSLDGKAADPASTSKVCKDAAAIARGKQMSDEYGKKSCSRLDVRREGAKWISDTVCKTGGTTMTSHSESTISDNAYHTETKATYDPPAPGRTSRTTIVDGKWLGPC